MASRIIPMLNHDPEHDDSATATQSLRISGTRNGLAVEQSLYQLSVLFRLRGPRREANHEQFIRQYNRSRLLLQGKRYDEAIAIMEDAFKARLNLYETTMGSFMLAIAYAQKGDWQRALFHIRHAVIEDGAYLEKSLRVIAFASQVELEVRHGNLAEAKCAFHQLRTIDSPSALGESKAAKMIATIDATLSNPKPLVTSATLATHPLLESAAVWRHQMLRPKFSFAEINGEVKSFRLACVGGSQEASVNLKTQWNVPSQSGRCLLRVEGETGATFRLIEEHIKVALLSGCGKLWSRTPKTSISTLQRRL